MHLMNRCTVVICFNDIAVSNPLYDRTVALQVSSETSDCNVSYPVHKW